MAGVAVAHALGSAALLAGAVAFVQGLDAMLWVCGGIALASAILALLFLPRRAEGQPGLPRPRVRPRPATGDTARTGQNWKMTGCQPAGLRERKKARTRASIREHALRLFREQGYQAHHRRADRRGGRGVTEHVLPLLPHQGGHRPADDMDTRMIEALERQPAGLGPLSAVRAALREVFTSYTQADLDLLGETTALTMTVPEIRARAMNEFARSISAISEALAKRAGRRG